MNILSLEFIRLTKTNQQKKKKNYDTTTSD